jgi:hypothetical protein
MQLFFKTILFDHTLPVEVEASDTVLDVKHKIANQLNLTSMNGLKVVLAGKELTDDDNLLNLNAHKEATIHLIVPRKKYLMIDHGGVLDGEITENKPGSNDLLLQTYSDGYYQVLKNGVQIIKNLNELIEKYRYEIVFHSKNKEKDQLKLLSDLYAVCNEKGITFPKVKAMAVFDAERFKDVDSKNPRIIKDNNNSIWIAGYGKELDGKACVRNALSILLDISQHPDDRKNHVVLDDGPSIVATAAKAEGYSAYEISGNQSFTVTVQQIIDNEKKLLGETDLPQRNELFTKPYRNLPLEFRRFLSESTQMHRHELGHISTEEYWTQICVGEKQQLFNQFNSATTQLSNSNSRCMIQ